MMIWWSVSEIREILGRGWRSNQIKSNHGGQQVGALRGGVCFTSHIIHSTRVIRANGAAGMCLEIHTSHHDTRVGRSRHAITHSCPSILASMRPSNSSQTSKKEGTDRSPILTQFERRRGNATELALASWWWSWWDEADKIGDRETPLSISISAWSNISAREDKRWCMGITPPP